MSAEDYKPLIGKRLLNNIYEASGTLLIAKGTVLLESHIKQLTKFRIRKDDVRAVDITDPIEHAKQTERYLSDINNFVHHNGVIPMAEVEEKVLPYIEETSKRYNLFQVFSELREQGDYRQKHSMGVAVVATSLGKRLGLDENELALLSTAATLYDIGMVKLPTSLISKPDRFDNHEYAIMKQHTVFGHELLQNSEVDPRIALVALQHHEREDGSGYPNGLRGDQIDRLSKIVALSDVYMALISERPHRQTYNFFEVIDEIHNQIIMKRFDSEIGLTLLDMLLSRQVGCEVLLSDNRKGKVLLTNLNYPSKPLVVLDNQEIVDLAKWQDIKIKEVIG